MLGDLTRLQKCKLRTDKDRDTGIQTHRATSSTSTKVLKEGAVDSHKAIYYNSFKYKLNKSYFTREFCASVFYFL